MSKTITLSSVERALEGWLKPNLLGEPWDNIGILVGSGKYSKDEKLIRRILLCNDLTPKVVAEAISSSTDLIISYHPAVKEPLKSISYGSWREEVIAKCIAYDIAVYSPHSTMDAVIGGINDRIMDYFRSILPPSESSLETIRTAYVDSSCPGIVYTSTAANISRLYNAIPFGDIADVSIGFNVENIVSGNKDSVSMGVYALKGARLNALEEIKSMACALDIPDFQKPTDAPSAALGAGRILRFKRPVPVEKIVERLKECTGISTIKIAQGPKAEIESIGLCVGSGITLLQGLKLDVLLTGEMKHSEVLDCLAKDHTVILCGHADSERHFLPTLAEIVKILTQCQNVNVSQMDQSIFRFV